MLLRNVPQGGLAILVTVCLGALPALGQAEGQATTQEAAPPTFVERLQARVEPLQVEDALEIKAYFSRPLLTWRIYFDNEAASRLVAEHVTSAPADPAARWYAWYCDLNEKLMALTEEEALKANELVFLNTDVSTEFSREGTQVCLFRGSRCVYVDQVPAGVELTLPMLSLEEPPDVRVTVTIQPEKTTWRAWETIRGSIFWKNTGTQRVALRPCDLPRVWVRREDGTSPPTVDARMYICSRSRPSSSPVVLLPGEQYERWLRVETDPLSTGDGVLLDDGQYDLYVPDMERRLGIPTECPPVRINVRTEPDQNLSPRIIYFGAGGSRLVLVRENGDVEVYDIESGQRLANGRVTDYVPMPSWEGELHVSPDGKRLALLRRPFGGPQATDIELYALDGESTSPRLLSLPPNACGGNGMRLNGFRAGGTRLYVSAGRSVWTINTVTGEIDWQTKLARSEWVTRDGERRVRLTEDKIEFYPRECAAASAVIPLDDAANMRLALIGNTGVYLEDGKTQTISYFSSDGQQQVAFGKDVAYVLAEASDGAMVAVRERQKGVLFTDGPIAIWRLDPPKILWRMADGKSRRIAFIDAPARVVCAFQDDRHYIVSTYAPTFEVYDAESGKLIRTIETPYRKP